MAHVRASVLNRFRRVVQLCIGKSEVGMAKEKSRNAAHVFSFYGLLKKKARSHNLPPIYSTSENTHTHAMSEKPKKIPMSTDEFYSCYERKRVKCDMSKVTVKELVRETKTGKTTTRYQAVGLDEQGRKLYKFIGSKDLDVYR